MPGFDLQAILTPDSAEEQTSLAGPSLRDEPVLDPSLPGEPRNGDQLRR
jgi:hypothetical protein